MASAIVHGLVPCDLDLCLCVRDPLGLRPAGGKRAGLQESDVRSWTSPVEVVGLNEESVVQRVSQVRHEVVADLRSEHNCVVDHSEGAAQAIVHVQFVASNKISFFSKTIANSTPLNEYG